MRSGVLGGGILLVIIGIILYFVGNNMVQQSVWYIISPDTYQSMSSTGNAMVMFGYIFGIVGFILCIAGIFAPSVVSEDKNSELKEKIHEEISSDKKSDEAMDILNKRYAKGEITKEEYEQMKKILKVEMKL